MGGSLGVSSGVLCQLRGHVPSPPGRAKNGSDIGIGLGPERSFGPSFACLDNHRRLPQYIEKSSSESSRSSHCITGAPAMWQGFWTSTTWMFYLLTCLAIMCRMGHQFYLQIKAPTSYRSNMHGDEGACVSALHMEVAVVFYCRHRPDPDLRVIILLFQCSPTETQLPTAIEIPQSSRKSPPSQTRVPIGKGCHSMPSVMELLMETRWYQCPSLIFCLSREKVGRYVY